MYTVALRCSANVTLSFELDTKPSVVADIAILSFENGPTYMYTVVE